MEFLEKMPSTVRTRNTKQEEIKQHGLEKYKSHGIWMVILSQQRKLTYTLKNIHHSSCYYEFARDEVRCCIHKIHYILYPRTDRYHPSILRQQKCS